jgi:hypothetical protein
MARCRIGRLLALEDGIDGTGETGLLACEQPVTHSSVIEIDEDGFWAQVHVDVCTPHKEHLADSDAHVRSLKKRRAA